MGFNSLEWSKRLQSAGLDADVADEQALMMTRSAEEHTVTKTDLDIFEQRVELKIDAAHKSLKFELALMVGGMIGVAVAAIVGLSRLI